MSPNDNTYRQPDEGTPDDAPVWVTWPGMGGEWELSTWWYAKDYTDYRGKVYVLAKENQGPPPEGWRPGTENVPSDDRNTNRYEEE